MARFDFVRSLFALARMRRGTTSIADHELVTLTGNVRLIGEPLIAPLSGTACVLHVSSIRVFGGARMRWVGIGPIPVGRRSVREVINSHTQVEMIDFILVTRDGDVRVCGTSAEVTLRPAPVIPRDLDRERAFLAASGIAGAKGADLASDEVVIEPDATISVHGVARIDIDSGAGGEHGYRDAPTTARIIGDDAHPLTIASA